MWGGGGKCRIISDDIRKSKQRLLYYNATFLTMLMRQVYIRNRYFVVGVVQKREEF